MNNRNPYTISFGKVPTKYLSRASIIDSIVEALESDIPDEQAFKLTGIRGTGKTVTLTSLERHFNDEKNWVVIGIRSDSDIISELVARLYSSVPLITKFVDANLNLSAFGIGINVSKKSPVASIDYALEILLSELNKHGKRLLVTIDEARNTKGIIDFIQEFQILIRKDLPIYTILAGLYEDIESLENTKGLTFFLRATKFEMTPLNITYIRDAFAYQTLGKYMWDSKGKTVTDEVLRQFDDVLAQKVYYKIWSELAPNDRWFLKFIAQKDSMTATDLLEITKKSHSEWSVPRKRLMEKGVIDTRLRGIITLRLPRFKEFIDAQIEF